MLNMITLPNYRINNNSIKFKARLVFSHSDSIIRNYLLPKYIVVENNLMILKLIKTFNY